MQLAKKVSTLFLSLKVIGLIMDDQQSMTVILIIDDAFPIFVHFWKGLFG